MGLGRGDVINTIWCMGLWGCVFVFFLVKEVPPNDSLLTAFLHGSPNCKDGYGGFSEKHYEGLWRGYGTWGLWGALRGSKALWGALKGHEGLWKTLRGFKRAVRGSEGLWVAVRGSEGPWIPVRDSEGPWGVLKDRVMDCEGFREALKRLWGSLRNFERL